MHNKKKSHVSKNAGSIQQLPFASVSAHEATYQEWSNSHVVHLLVIVLTVQSTEQSKNMRTTETNTRVIITKMNFSL